MSTAIRGQGMKVQRGNGAAPEVFATIGSITDFKGPGESVKAIDTSSVDQAAKTFLGSGLVDGGEYTISFIMNFLDLMQIGLRSDLIAGNARNFKVQYADDLITPANGTIAAFAAIVTKFEPSGKMDDKVVGSVTLKVTGAVTYTPTTGL